MSGVVSISDRLLAVVQELGVRAGDVPLVHSSRRVFLGGTGAGADADGVIDTLLEAVMSGRFLAVLNSYRGRRLMISNRCFMRSIAFACSDADHVLRRRPAEGGS